MVPSLLMQRQAGVSFIRLAAAILALPFMVVVVVPTLLVVYGQPVDTRWGFEYPLLAVPRVLAAALALAGLALLAWTIGLFATVGKGTLAAWDPTRNLVVAGPYRHVRNPMISGVFLVLAAWSAAFGSLMLLGWAGLFLGVNHLYFLLAEEPGLEKRFGPAYREYSRHVPRWLPRLIPWLPPANED